MTQIPVRIIESDRVLEYLKKRSLLKQYQKIKGYILNGYIDSADFKKRKPHKDDIRSFRINQQYRAFGFFDRDVFKVASISDHSNF